MNLWLVPASDDVADANVAKTLAGPISQERAQRAGVAAGLHAWGARASSDMNVNKFNKMRPGDWCLFYTKAPNGGPKRYRWKGMISEKIQDRKVAEALWDDPSFELVYFLDDVTPIDLAPEQLSAGFARFRKNYFNEAPKGFTAIDPEVLNGIVEQYGGVDPWLTSLQRPLHFLG
jgi:hypothetical protein